MNLSKHNIISSIADSEEFFIINPLSQEADILTREQHVQILQGNYPNKQELIKKGYLIDPGEEERQFKRKYLEFLDRREEDEIQLFFIPTYSCNFDCKYCYQLEYQTNNYRPDKTIIDSFFSFIDKWFTSRRKYITVFGGEPLLNTKWDKELLNKLIYESVELLKKCNHTLPLKRLLE